MSALSARSLTVSYGAVRAVDGVDLDLAPGEVLALIGPNGAGKTSVLDALTGLVPHGGTVRVGDRELASVSPERMAAVGVARTFQGLGIFPRLTVTENLLVGRHLATRHGAWAAVLGLPRTRRAEAREREVVAGLVASLGLPTIVDERVERLPYGLRKRVELGRALAREPAVLLLDEPFAGMARAEVEPCLSLLRRVTDDGCAVLLVEHDVALVAEVADRALVLHAGRSIAVGTPAAVREDPAVLAAYLGRVR